MKAIGRYKWPTSCNDYWTSPYYAERPMPQDIDRVRFAKPYIKFWLQVLINGVGGWSWINVERSDLLQREYDAKEG